MDLKEAKGLFGGPAPPGSGLIFTEREKERQKEGRKRGGEKAMQRVGEKQRRTVRCGGRDRESGQT